VSVLNAGFENGATVPRLEKRGEQFVTVRHEVFCPRALAGIKGLRDTLEDRSIQIFMVRRKRSEAIERITIETDAEAATIRDLCALACLDGFQDIATAYEGAAAVLVHRVPNLDDRAVDLWAPLFAIAVAADAEDNGDRHRRMLAAIRSAGQLRDADAEDGPTVRLIGALDRIAAGQDRNMTPTDLMGALKQGPGFEWITSTKALANLLNPIGIFRRQVRVGTKRPYFYVIEQEMLQDLRERYGARGE
jgi:Protein of unknown function (DUF3631)